MTSAERTVLLVDDDEMVRAWVRLALEGSEFQLVGEAATPAEARELIPRRAPGLLLLDFRLGERFGTDLLRELRGDGISVPAVVMTARKELGLNEAARAAGAQGSVLKTGRAEELLDALRKVARGESAFDWRHVKRPPEQATLSPREREVLRLVAAGATNREVAAQLSVGEETVKTLIGRTFAKLGARRRAEAVSLAHQQGLL